MGNFECFLRFKDPRDDEIEYVDIIIHIQRTISKEIQLPSITVEEFIP